MKAKFSISERCLLLQLVPSEASIMTLRVAQTMKRKIGFSAEEIKDFEMKEDNGHVIWKMEKAKEVEIQFSDAEVEMIKRTLQKLDKEEKLVEQHLSLWDKFCG